MKVIQARGFFVVIKSRIQLPIYKIMLVALLSGCVAMPMQYTKKNGCKLLTPSWKLEFKTYNADCMRSREALIPCLALFGVIVPAISTVVSGSIVLVGNTLHWLEYQGRCSGQVIDDNLEEHREKWALKNQLRNL